MFKKKKKKFVKGDDTSELRHHVQVLHIDGSTARRAPGIEVDSIADLCVAWKQIRLFIMHKLQRKIYKKYNIMTEYMINLGKVAFNFLIYCLPGSQQ